MAASGPEYTVLGFGSGFDGRPTVFVNAFPPTRVCSACGLVPSTAGLLPCRHVLCHRCYDRCVEDERSQCPLDKHVFQNEDVAWSTFSKDNILVRKIQCWNARNGCEDVGPASEILQHFNNDCQHYAATCQRCRRTMAQKEAVDHVKSGSCVHEQPQAAPALEGAGAGSLLESLQSLDNRVTESTRVTLDAIQEINDKQRSLERNMTSAIQVFREEVDGILEQLESRVENKCGENAEKILAACASVETVTNDLKADSFIGKQEAAKVLKAIEDTVTKRQSTEEQLSQLKKELDEKFTVVMAASKALLGNVGVLKSSEPLEWTIDGWAKLKDMQKRGDKAESWAKEPGFFYGYLILPGAQIIEIGGILSLRLAFHICKGRYDQLLTWPFEKELCYKVVHPFDVEKVECNNAVTKGANLLGLRLPTTPRSERVVGLRGIAIGTLEANGYVQNDQITFQFDVLP